MDPVLVWALVALAALVGLYDLGRRWIATHRKAELDEALKPIRQVLDIEGQRGDMRLSDVQRLEELTKAHGEKLVELQDSILRRAVGIETLIDRCNKLQDGAELARQDATKHRADFDEHVKLFETICLQWRAKAGELESQINRVTSDAKNEINGALQGVDALTGTRKGWR